MDNKVDLENLPNYTAFSRQFSSNQEDLAISLTNYAISELTPDLLIAVSKIFLPDFIEYEGGIFLADKLKPPMNDSWLKRYRNNMSEAELLINHIHLGEDWQSTGFVGKTNAIASLSNQNLWYLGEVLVVTWKAALMAKFPERKFIVQGNRDEQVGDFIITFYQPQS
jgi:hypothetical protein